jgi:signal transduction histidine kinase
MTGAPDKSILSDYQRLKDWYLARLRQEAVERGAEQLTPAALVAADRQVVEALALAAAASSSSGQRSQSGGGTDNGAVLFLACAALVAGLLGWLMIAGTNNSIPLMALWCIAILALLALAWNTQRNSLSRLTQSQKELLSRESLIADLSPSLLCLLDRDGKLLAWNASFAKQTANAPAALYHRELAAMFLAEDRAPFSAALQRAAGGATSAQVETRLPAAQETVLDIAWTIEWSQSTQSYFASGANVTSERLVERTRNEFVAMISHDIRTPLSAVSANLQTLQAGLYGELPEEAQNCVGRSYNSSRRLIGLISELLDFEAAAAQAGKVELEKAPADLAALTALAIAECADLAKQKSIRVVCDVEPVTADVDAGKLVRVLINLLINAIKYSPESTSVEVSASTSTARYVEIAVRDQGPGINKDEQKLVFERYFRSAKHKDSLGSGLGLAICKRIVESHGGLIGVKPNGERGAHFWFTLPLSP